MHEIQTVQGTPQPAPKRVSPCSVRIFPGGGAWEVSVAQLILLSSGGVGYLILSTASTSLATFGEYWDFTVRK